MEQYHQETAKEDFLLWIEPEKHILSFHSVDGFIAKSFVDRASMLSFAQTLAFSGYRVQ